MIHYLDTSAIVKRYVDEDGSATMRSLWQSGESFSTSRLSLVEISSAFSRLVREKHLSKAERKTLQSRFQDDLERFNIVDPSHEVLDLAAHLCTVHPLRAYDAVQLGSAIHLQARLGSRVTFVTADARLLKSAAESDLATLAP